MKAALDYGRLGWSVIPVESRGKRPLIAWQAYQYRHTDAAEVAEWFRRWPDANLAVVTGIVSRLMVLEVDPRNGADASLAQWAQEHGPLAETVEALAGGVGRYLYFSHPGEVMPNRVAIAPGVDLCGDGGYVVAPPSVHSCGEPYRWERSPDVCRLAPLPEWLRREASGDRRHPQHPLIQWRLWRDGVAEGQRKRAIVSLAEHLLGQGVDPLVTADLLLTWNTVRCCPPLDDEEVERALESIRRQRQRQRAGSGDA